MSMIESQIKRLEALIEGMKLDEKLGRVKCSGFSLDNRVKIINDAISTIQDLSAKLAAANMERSSAYYNGGWIPAEERLPEERDWYLAVFQEIDTGFQLIPRVAENIDTVREDTTSDGWQFIDGEKFTSEYLHNLKCVAWMPLPEPYKKEV